MKIETFEDIAVITALARPGPLQCGGTAEFIARRTGKRPIIYLHALAKEILKPTCGIVVYQEQVMTIARKIGDLSWADVSSLRKAMSKSLGKEFFDMFYIKFEEGAIKNSVSKEEAKEIWGTINTMGAWAFNRSHAVSYAMISYWCMVLKAHYPMEFAASCLRSAKDEAQSIKILRELVREGYEFMPYHKEHSRLNWTVKNGVLIGGLTNIKGIAEKSAKLIINKIENNELLTPRQKEFLESGITPFDNIFEAQDKWGHVYSSPNEYNIASKIWRIGDITDNHEGEVLIIGKITAVTLRDHNDATNVARRGGKLMGGPISFLNVVFEDDTGEIIGTVSRFKFEKLAPLLMATENNNCWYLIKGFVQSGWRKISISRYKKLTGNKEYEVQTNTG